MPRFQFGDVAVDTDAVEVVGPDGRVDIEPQAFDVLSYLVEQPGRLVTKEELLDNVWGDRFVSESALTTRIKQARRALGDDGRTQWAIKTVHGRGYRFVAPRDEAPSSSQPQPPEVTGSLPDELRADTRQMFVGRADELGRAMDVLTRTEASGSFGWIWVVGEPGIGKTRMAAEIAREAHDRGHRVLFGRNNEDLRVPHQPFIEVIRAAAEQQLPGDVTRFFDQLSPDLAPLLPSRPPTATPDASTPTGLDDESRRYRLFEAVVSWLAEQASAAPLTVVVDDVHWAAESTVQLLSHMYHRTSTAPVTFVITGRDTAPDINPRVADLLSAAHGRHDTEVVRLEGLSEVDALRFVGNTVVLADVMRQTAGNPLLLQAVNPSDGSVDVGHAVRRRLAGLTPRVQETLQAASIIGLEFELPIAAAATRRDELDVLDDLEEAIAARLLDDVGVDRFRFTHALIRSSLGDDLSSARRARMHRRTAEAIEMVFPSSQMHLLALARHTSEATTADPSLRPVAIARLERAAHESMRQLSFEEAAAAYRDAVALADPADQELCGRLLLEQGIAEARAGSSMTAMRTFDAALGIARSSGNVVLEVESALRYEDATWRPGLSGVAAIRHLTDAERALDDAIASGATIHHESEWRARLAIGLLRSLAMTGAIDEVEERFPGAHEQARGLRSATLEASVLNVYVSHVRLLRGLDGTRDLVTRLAELQPDIDDDDVALHTVHVRALHAFIDGDFSRVREMADLMAHLQEHSNSSFWRFIRTNQEAMEAFHRGDLRAAEDLAEACLDLANELPEEDGSGTYGLRMFMIRREQDQLASVAPLVRRVLSTGDITGVWTPGLALLLTETGAAEEAAELVSEIKAASFDLPRDAMWSTVMVFLIEVMVSLGDIEACSTLRSRFAQLAGTNVTMGSGLMSFGSADRYLGMLLLTMGDLDAAGECLTVALEADSASGSTLWANESRRWLSYVRRAQGQTTEAEALLEVVASQADDAGLARLARLAREPHR